MFAKVLIIVEVRDLMVDVVCWQVHIADYRNEWCGREKRILDFKRNGSNPRFFEKIRKPVKTIREREAEISSMCQGYDPFPKILEGCPRAIHQLDRIAKGYNLLIDSPHLRLDKIYRVVDLALRTIEKYVPSPD